MANLICEEFARDTDVRRLKSKTEAIAAYLSRHRDVRNEVKRVASLLRTGTALPQTMSTTRWSSLYFLFKSVKDNYTAIVGTPKMNNHLLEVRDLELLEEVVDIIEHIHVVLKQLESDNSFISDIVPAFRCALDEIESKGTGKSQVLATIVKARVGSYIENDLILVSLFVDPRYAFIPGLVEPKTWEDVSIIVNLKRPSASSAKTMEPCVLEKATGVGAFLNKKISTTEKASNDFETEILRYRALLNANRPAFESSPLQFWNAQKRHFPQLAEIAKTVLSAPASSATSERLFSRCSDVLRQKKRNGLKTETLNAMLLTIAVNDLHDDNDSDSADDSDSYSGDMDSGDEVIPNQNEMPPNQSAMPLNRDEMLSNQHEMPPNQNEMPSNQDEMPSNRGGMLPNQAIPSASPQSYGSGSPEY